MQKELFNLLNKITEDNKRTYNKIIKIKEEIAEAEIDKILQIFCTINIEPIVQELEPNVIIEKIDYRGMPKFKNVSKFEFTFTCTENMKDYILNKIPDFEDHLDMFENEHLGSWNISNVEPIYPGNPFGPIPTVRREDVTPVAPEPPRIRVSHETPFLRVTNSSGEQSMVVDNDGNIHINAQTISITGEPGLDNRRYSVEAFDEAIRNNRIQQDFTNFQRELLDLWRD